MSSNAERSSALANNTKRDKAMATATVKTHHWTREEYEQAVERGAFEGLRIELVDGALYDMTPQSSRHAGVTAKVYRALSNCFPSDQFEVRHQVPLSLGEDSVPEPDIAVVTADPEEDDYTSSHPQSAVLVVEVADTSLPHDRQRKRHLYARAGVPEYWIVNLTSRKLEVYRDPAPEGYERVTALGTADAVSPLSCPGASIPVAKLFPKLRTS